MSRIAEGSLVPFIGSADHGAAGARRRGPIASARRRATYLLLLVALAVASLVVAPPDAWSRSRFAPRAVATMPASALPVEGRQVLAAIEAGGPFAYRRDGIVFANREGLLPPRPRGYYAEYTVPTPGAGTRGARRIIAGKGGTGDVRTSDEYYYSDDHYQSFRRIVQ